MTIYKLKRESEAWKIIITLHKLHININWLVLWLKDSSRNVTTVDLITTRDSWAKIHTAFNDFNNNHGNWFQTAWPDYYNSLTGAISSFVNINNVINNGLQNWYWDPDTGKPIVSDISQTHRNLLADQIQDELER